VGRAVDKSAAIQVRPIEADDASIEVEVGRFDARCYGADRAALVRRALREHRGRAFAARDASGELVGYCIGQTRSLGPCMARSTDVARVLFRRTLALPYENGVTWLVAYQNRDAVALARELGGVPARRLRHMRRGDPASLASDWSTLYAKVSLAVG
jgi:Acetyltransferase (GNAT) domain